MRSFVKWNQAVSRKLTSRAISETSVFSMFPKLAGLIFGQPGTRRVLDAGAGAAWAFPTSYKETFGLYLVGVDIDPEEMSVNPALDERLVSDVCARLPVEDGSIDLITAYSGVEHFPDNEAFLRNCYTALRPGGRWVAQFPSRYASFAILNRMLPQGISKILLRRLRPDAADHIGFKAHYDKTNYSSFSAMAKGVGFEVEYYHLSYFHHYFAFFFPLYILSVVTGILRMATGATDFATYNLVVLRRPGPGDDLILGQQRNTIGIAPTTPLLRPD